MGFLRTFLVASLLLFAGEVARSAQGVLLTTDQERALAHWDLIQGAQKTVDVSYFAVHQDRAGLALVAALREAVREGKAVRLVLDPVGSDLSPDTISYLIQEGVQVRYYHERGLHPKTWDKPLSWIWRRSHDKLLVVDQGSHMLTGTENIGEQYYGKLLPTHPSRFVGRNVILDGEPAATAQKYFSEVWDSPETREPRRLKPLSPAASAKQKRLLDSHFKLFRRFDKRAKDLARRPDTKTFDLTNARFVHNTVGMAPGKPGIQDELIKLITGAKKRILLETPYLLPTPELKRALAAKIKEGVQVSLYTNSFHSNDNRIPVYAYTRAQNDLRNMGVEVYEFAGKDTLHAKAVVVDGEQAYLGSFNLNQRSANLDEELGIIAESREFAQALEQEITSHEVLPPDAHKPTVVQACLRGLMDLILSPVKGQM